MTRVGPEPRMTECGPLEVTDVTAEAFRVGFAPEPFAWTPWEYAEGGHFDGRWDDPDGAFRTLYLGDSLLGCLLEVLARFRPDPAVVAELAGIIDDDDAETVFPTLPAGRVPRSWMEPRLAGSAQLTGEFIDVRHSRSVAVLHRLFAVTARGMGFADLDAAALKTASPRRLTQNISRWLYWNLRPPVTGIAFASRHGDELTMWALYEQADDDGGASGALSSEASWPLNADITDVVMAMDRLGLEWADC